MIVLAGPAGAQDTAARHATGSFEVTLTPEANAPASGGDLATARLGMRKRFSGGLAGEAQGTMISAGTPKPGEVAAYVAIDQVRGTLDGRAGSFVLVHRGYWTKAGGGNLTVEVAPDSGTGALAGLAGTLTITMRDGRHFYDLAYTLPRTR